MSALVVPGRQRSEILEPIDGTFDDVAAFVRLCVKFRWPTTAAPFLDARFTRVFPLGADTPDLAAPQLLTVFPRPIGSIHAQDRRPFAGSARTGPTDADLVEQRDHARRVAGLTFGDQNREWTTLPIAQDVDFTVSSPSADPEPFGLDRPLFSIMAGRFRAPTALRWALQLVLSSEAPSQSIFP